MTRASVKIRFFLLYDFRRFVRYGRSPSLFRRSYQLRPFYRGPRRALGYSTAGDAFARSQAKASRGAGVGSGRHA
jgi:hypothetical protein